MFESHCNVFKYRQLLALFKKAPSNILDRNLIKCPRAAIFKKGKGRQPGETVIQYLLTKKVQLQYLRILSIAVGSFIYTCA